MLPSSLPAGSHCDEQADAFEGAPYPRRLSARCPVPSLCMMVDYTLRTCASRAPITNRKKKEKKKKSHKRKDEAAPAPDSGAEEAGEEVKAVRMLGAGRITSSGLVVHGSGTKFMHEFRAGDGIEITHPTSCVAPFSLYLLVYVQSLWCCRPVASRPSLCVLSCCCCVGRLGCMPCRCREHVPCCARYAHIVVCVCQ